MFANFCLCYRLRTGKCSVFAVTVSGLFQTRECTTEALITLFHRSERHETRNSKFVDSTSMPGGECMTCTNLVVVPGILGERLERAVHAAHVVVAVAFTKHSPHTGGKQPI